MFKNTSGYPDGIKLRMGCVKTENTIRKITSTLSRVFSKRMKEVELGLGESKYFYLSGGKI